MPTSTSISTSYISLRPWSGRNLSDPGPDRTTVDGVNFVGRVIEPLRDEFGLMDDAVRSFSNNQARIKFLAIIYGHDETILMWLGTLSLSLRLEKLVYIDHGDEGLVMRSTDGLWSKCPRIVSIANCSKPL